MTNKNTDTSKVIAIGALSFVNFLGFTIFIPVLPFIVRDFGAPEWVYGVLLASYPLAQFFGAPILGEYSDRKGRKPILLISQFGTMMSWTVVALSYFVSQIDGIATVWPLGILFLARIIDGITGGNVSVANAYLADITPPEKRTERFGRIGAIVGVSLLIGPGLGSLSSSTRFGYLGLAILAFIISLVTLLLIWRYLEETLPESERSIATSRWYQKINIFSRIRNLETRPGGKFMLGLSGGFGVIQAAYQSIIVLFIIDRFGLSQTELGVFLLFVGSFLIFNQEVMVKLFVRRIGELETFFAGLAFVAIGFIGITLTSTLWVYTIIYYVLNLGLSLLTPTIRSLLSQSVSNKKQGEVLGLDESLRSASMATMPIVFGALYGAITYRSFYIITAVVVFMMLLFYFSKSRRKLQER